MACWAFAIDLEKTALFLRALDVENYRFVRNLFRSALSIALLRADTSLTRTVTVSRLLQVLMLLLVAVRAGDLRVLPTLPNLLRRKLLRQPVVQLRVAGEFRRVRGLRLFVDFLSLELWRLMLWRALSLGFDHVRRYFELDVLECLHVQRPFALCICHFLLLIHQLDSVLIATKHILSLSFNATHQVLQISVRQAANCLMDVLLRWPFHNCIRSFFAWGFELLIFEEQTIPPQRFVTSELVDVSSGLLPLQVEFLTARIDFIP